MWMEAEEEGQMLYCAVLCMKDEIEAKAQDECLGEDRREPRKGRV